MLSQNRVGSPSLQISAPRDEAIKFVVITFREKPGLHVVVSMASTCLQIRLKQDFIDVKISIAKPLVKDHYLWSLQVFEDQATLEQF